MRKSLNLGSFFTTGTDEVRQWTIRNGTKAPQAAGVIHGDFEKTFIQAIVYNYDVLKDLGDEAEVKAKGKVMTKGKDYVVEDGGQYFIYVRDIELTSYRHLADQGWRCERIENSYRNLIESHEQRSFSTRDPKPPKLLGCLFGANHGVWI